MREHPTAQQISEEVYAAGVPEGVTLRRRSFTFLSSTPCVAWSRATVTPEEFHLADEVETDGTRYYRWHEYGLGDAKGAHYITAASVDPAVAREALTTWLAAS